MFLAVAPLALLAFTPSSALLPAQGDDVARIMPADAAVLLRLESAQAWDDLMRAFAPLAGEGVELFELQRTLDGMASAEADPATLPRLDPARPLFAAVSFDPASGPTLTFAVPVTNGQAFSIDETFGPTTSTLVGSYAAVTNAPEFVPSTAPNPALAALRPGLMSLHVDLAQIIATLRPLIEMGLAQAEGALDQIPSEDMPFDIQPMMEVYLEMARDLIDSARVLDLALEHEGEQVSMRMAYTDSEERAPAAVLEDMGPMIGLMDPASPVQIAFNGKWTEYLSSFEDLIDASLEMYPEPLRSDMRRILEQQQNIGALLAPGLVSSFDMGPAGMRGAYYARATDPEKLLAALEQMLRSLDHEDGMVRLGASESLAIEGVEARSFSLEMRYESLLELFAQAAPEAGEVQEAELAEMREALQALYGENLRMALARRGEIVALCVGASESDLRADLARLGAPAQPDPRMTALIQELEPGAMGFAYHADFGRFIGRMTEAMQALSPAAVFPELDAAMDFWGSMRGASWSAGMRMDLAELIGFVREMETLEGK